MGYDYYIRSPRDPQLEWPDPFTDALIAMGMGFEAEDYFTVPPWPDRAEYGVQYDEWDGHVIGERAKEFEDAVAEVLRWRGPEIPPGIPVPKVCTSNDGWHVTREECRAALRLYEFAIRDGKTHPEAFGDDFIPFLRAAAEADGFEIN
jgi:hypothetical protein